MSYFLEKDGERSTIGINIGRTKCGKRLRDGAAALVLDGRVAFAAAEERFSRDKHAPGFERSLGACMEISDLNSSEVDLIVVSSCCESLRTSSEITDQYPCLSEFNVEVVRHHRSHAFSAFAVSPFEESLIITMDAGGNLLKSVQLDPSDDAPWSEHRREQFTTYIGSDNEVSVFQRDFADPNDAGFGEVYRAFTYYLGWPSHIFSANTMAMAAYGDPYKFQDLKLFDCKQGDLVSHVDNRPSSPVGMVEKTARDQRVDIPSPRNNFEPAYPEDLPNDYCHLAARLQYEFERALTKKVEYLIGETGLSNICIAGGVGLNCVANRKVLDLKSVDDVFIQPAAGDTGQALGNALYGYHEILGGSREKHPDKFSPYLGPEYDLAPISLRKRTAFRTAIDKGNITSTTIEDPASIAADMISSGSVVGWFQGRSEYGPRALGNRSILADPRDENTKLECHRVKNHREPHRPFSPSIISERASDFFHIQRETPYMIIVSDVKRDMKANIPAVVHCDNTSRIQTVARDDNERFYKLLREFESRTGIPLVLNTSFNASGDPIVESPDDALQTFLKLPLDALFVGNMLIQNEKSHADPLNQADKRSDLATGEYQVV